MKRIFLLCSVLSFVLAVLCSCAANPPKDEREFAEKAFKDAEAGKDCDRENYLAAEELLRQAREEVNNKNYDKAKELFKAVKEKSDAIAKYYSEHPDECMPQKAAESDNAGNGGIKEEDVVSSSDQTLDPSNPDMDFQVIHFNYNEYSVIEEDLPKLELMVQWMINFPERVVRIEGHADERGTNDYNLSLGEKRAMEVRNKLVQAGIDSQRIKIVSYGEERPVDPASTEEAWFQNRRAEFKREN